MLKSFYEIFDWYEYLVRAGWTKNGRFFYVQIYDRLQQRAATLLLPLDYFIDEENSNIMCENFHQRIYIINEDLSFTWINFNDTMCFLDDENDSVPQLFLNYITASEETGFLHLYHYKINLHDSSQISNVLLRSNNIVKTQLTDGEWCIEYDKNIWIDQNNNLVYFIGYQNPLESQLFVVDVKNPKHLRQLTTSGFSHQIFMDKKCKNFVSVCSNLAVPHKAYIFEISNQQNGIQNIVVKKIAYISNKTEFQDNILEASNAKLGSYIMLNSLLDLKLDPYFLYYDNHEAQFKQEKNLQQHTMPIDEEILLQNIFRPPQIFSFLTEDNVKLYGMIYLPYNYEPSVKYPTVLYVYAGPKAQIVTNAYKANKYSRFNLLSLLGYCVLVIDSRGSDYRGHTFEAHLYKRMGTVEINDQVKGLEYAANTFNCIDRERVAIFGWSYGGYMALMGLSQRPDIFKVAISGAPVTTWNFYDTAYTERYMSLPDENEHGYEKGSVLNYAKNFPNEENRLLIIHGMIDENVHFAHTRKLIDALIKENKPYQLQVYPHERHGIRSPEASIHCDVNLFLFLEQNLK